MSLSSSSTPAAMALPTQFLSLKLAKAHKNGARSHGYLLYRVLTDLEHEELFFTLVGNDGAGCYSREVIPLSKIEQCLQGVNATKPIPSKVLQSAFVSRSANNAGFLAAVLRMEALLLPAPESVHQHLIAPDWNLWKQAMHALIPTAEPFQPEPAKPRNNKTTIAANDQATDHTSADASTDDASADLSAAELDLLQRSGDGDSDSPALSVVDAASNAADVALAGISSDDALEPSMPISKTLSRKPRIERLQHPTGGKR